ncbi:MAG: chloride channel protein [Labilithrix sp.]|nr:chloride channel protein [Labilithrix sp.]MCW5813007.1 chloride channel protein [Labilithrix sp.]
MLREGAGLTPLTWAVIFVVRGGGVRPHPFAPSKAASQWLLRQCHDWRRRSSITSGASRRGGCDVRSNILAALKRRANALLQWIGLGAAVGLACGGASAFFLTLLEHATQLRESHEQLVYTLPIAGLVIGFLYDRWGKPIKGGNNLVLDTMHESAPQIPFRMAPMVLLGTVLTHVFGGSAGREGTAVQMGASLADEIAHRARVGKETRRQLLAAGIAGGFGSVFGTPIAGTVFGMEVVSVGRIEYDAFLPALVASVVGDLVTRRLGIVHTPYPRLAHVELTGIVLGKLAVMAVAMALATIAFVELTHRLKHLLERKIRWLSVRMCVGGICVVVMWKLIGTSDYLGLGVPMIVRSFDDPSLPWFAFAAKLVFTSVTLAAGFLGGEVTPLFFVGATLGSVLARLLGLPIELGAGVGLAAVFGAAANTPIALSIMAVELLGAEAFPHVVIVSVIAYILTGHRGIYPAQRIQLRKHGGLLRRPVPLRDYRDSTAPPDS